MKQDTNMREAFPVETRVAAGLWRLATGNTYLSSGLQFGMGKSTAQNVSTEFENALAARRDEFIRFPTTHNEIQTTINNFEMKYGIPQIVGVVDGSHIEITAPHENKEDYYNRKCFYSINLQAITNSRLKFQHIAIGFPGSIHDARVLRLSGIYNLAERGQICSMPKRNINDVEIPPMLVGDSAYPLRHWLVKPFQDRGNLTREDKKFNKKLCGLRASVEQTLGILKSRWRILRKLIEQRLDNVNRTITAACVLHNFCIDLADNFDNDDDSDINDDDNDADVDDAPEGEEIREALKQHLIDTGVI